MSSGKTYPNPKTVHTFCIPPNCSGIQKFRMNIADPTLNTIFSALHDNKSDSQGNDLSRPAHSVNKYKEENDNYDPVLPEVISCDVSCLDDIEFIAPTECVSIVQADLNDFLILGNAEPSNFTDVVEAFIGVMNTISTNFDMFMIDDPACIGETLDLYAIFDGKLPVIWGKNIEDDESSMIAFERLPFRFPLTFDSFSIGFYSRTNNIFYEPIEYSY